VRQKTQLVSARIKKKRFREAIDHQFDPRLSIIPIRRDLLQKEFRFGSDTGTTLTQMIKVTLRLVTRCKRRVHRGRDASYPTPPAQIPACRFLAPGSSEILASAGRRCYCLRSLSQQ